MLYKNDDDMLNRRSWFVLKIRLFTSIARGCEMDERDNDSKVVSYLNPKHEIRNPKRFDRLTALSKVEEQIQISNTQMIEEPRSKVRGMRSLWRFKHGV